jgi:hypothetical protein
MQPLELLEPHVRARFEAIEADLRETAAILKDVGRRMDRAEKRLERADKRAERAEKRAERAEKRHEQDHKIAMGRLDRTEKLVGEIGHKLDITAKLVAAGIKMVSEMRKDTQELKQAQKAFLASFRNGRNGRSH